MADQPQAISGRNVVDLLKKGVERAAQVQQAAQEAAAQLAAQGQAPAPPAGPPVAQ